VRSLVCSASHLLDERDRREELLQTFLWRRAHADRHELLREGTFRLSDLDVRNACGGERTSKLKEASFAGHAERDGIRSGRNAPGQARTFARRVYELGCLGSSGNVEAYDDVVI